MIHVLDPVVRPVIRSAKSLGLLINLPRKIRSFEPRIRIRVERDPYVIRTVENPKEFSEALRLRYEVFEREFRGNQIPIGWDTDEYDLLGDHLIIVDTRTGKIVGNYRLISSTYSRRFYSDSEFEVSQFLSQPGIKLELGRACIHQDYRNGTVMSLLWRGVTEYVRKTGARSLFGCASIKTTDAGEVSWLMKRFERQALEGSGVVPVEEYRMPGLGRPETPSPERQKELLPPLLLSYFRAGAKVALEPAYDRYFKCVDFFTALDTDRMTESYGRKFGVAPDPR